MATMNPDPQFVPLVQKLKDTYIVVGRRSYREHYTQLWQRDDPSPFLQSSFRDGVVIPELQDPGLSHYIIYQRSKAVGILKLVNNCSLYPYSSKDALLLEKLYLLHAASNQGIGKRALGFVEEVAKGLDKKLVWLDTMQEGPALEFYLKNGYEVKGQKLLEFPGVLEARRPMYILGKELP